MCVVAESGLSHSYYFVITFVLDTNKEALLGELVVILLGLRTFCDSNQTWLDVQSFVQEFLKS